MARRVSLKDVATAAGVSPTTASRVLAGVDRGVAPELAERVQAATVELGYRVNAAARALRLQTTGSIALVVPSVANPYYAELVAAYSRQLDAEGRRVVTFDTNDSVTSERRQLEDMDRVLVDAVLIAPVDHEGSAPAIAALAATHTVVQVDRIAAGVSAPAVRLDNAAGIRLLVDHLHASGRERIVLVDAEPRSSASRERAEAFRAVTGLGCTVLQMPTFSMHSGTEAARILRDNADMPDAVICTADVVSLGLLTAFQHAGLRVPQDVALATFDGTALSGVTSPGLTTLESAVDEIVRASLEIVDGTRTESLLVQPRVLVRESTGH
ncbi:LacI family transcriptional regulator [Mycetocola tolaasinivorans]|uniref:LacI family transcriptional regulator n=1 Tax=Mycetocola tolaasinivorans TaxID=76635 RepID=A0A3L7A5I6_9MICO|nr:LacI family DNA-binding transcriptional regulator [Mycetocola tolaasinivorans]RLP75315.1 LacI family transcriptional regulator [Mycetocola tolaasinivorans]